MKQADPAMPQIMRREGRNTGRDAGTAKRSPEAIATEALKDPPLGNSIVACNERRHCLKELGRDRDPFDVSPAKPFELTQPHSRRVEHE